MNDRQLRMFKRAFMPLTDQAMAAQGAPMPPQGGAPMDPAMMGGMPPQGAPMPPPGAMPPVDPATGMPIDPNTGMPMDPNMMAQGGTPPQGAPMPPQGGAPISTGDMVIDMLLEMGAMIVDPSGQPVPPEMLAQLVQEMNAQTGGMPQGGAPQQDPNGDAVLETMAQLDRNVSIMMDKVDSMRALIDNLVSAKESVKEESNKGYDQGGGSNDVDPELMAYLNEQAMAGEPMPAEQAPVEAIPQGAIDPQQAQQLGLIQAMQGGMY